MWGLEFRRVLFRSSVRFRPREPLGGEVARPRADPLLRVRRALSRLRYPGVPQPGADHRWSPGVRSRPQGRGPAVHGLAVRASPASPIAIGGVALIAAALTIVFALLVAPAWEPALDDQVQYQAPAHGLPDRGEDTRATAAPPFIAQPPPPPGYPPFLP